MDTLFHFILALAGGLALGFFRRYGIGLILFASSVSILIDVDHFLLPLGLASRYTLFHNVFVVFFLPLILFISICYHQDTPRPTRLQGFFLMMIIMLTGHVIFDMFCGPIMFLYPLSDMELMIPEIEIMLTSSFRSPVIGPGGIAMTMYVLVILFGVFVDRIIR